MINLGKPGEAEAACRTVLREAPGLPEATALLGFIVARMRRLKEAESLLREAIAKRSDVPQWHFELCNVLRYDFRLDESLAEAREAVRLDPTSAQFRNGLAQIHFDRGEYDQGYNTILDALACDPEDPKSHLSLAHALLASGNFRAGWAEYEWRFRSKIFIKALPKPIRLYWNGMPLPGRRLVISTDQDFGDSFQFARYIPMAAARVGEVVVLPAAADPVTIPHSRRASLHHRSKTGGRPRRILLAGKPAICVWDRSFDNPDADPVPGRVAGPPCILA